MRTRRDPSNPALSNAHGAFAMMLGGAILATNVSFAMGTQGEESIERSTASPGDQYVDVKLAMDYAGFTPGKSVLVGLTFDVEDQWHTYWPGLSDTGFGIILNTEAPEGIKVGEPIWPTPHRYLMPGDILDHIYEGEFTILIPLEIDKDLDPGTPMTLTTHISYLVCKEVCLPGSFSIAFSETVLDPRLERPKPGADHGWIHELFDARAMPLRTQRPDSQITIDTDRVSIFVPGATKLVFYPSSGCVELTELITQGETKGDTLSLNTNPQDGDILEGRLEVFDAQGTPRSYTLRTPAMPED